MKKIVGNKKGYTIGELVVSIVGIGVVVALVWGYILNLIALIGLTELPLSLIFVVRCIGTILVPVGSILGLFF